MYKLGLALLQMQKGPQRQIRRRGPFLFWSTALLIRKRPAAARAAIVAGD